MAVTTTHTRHGPRVKAHPGRAARRFGYVVAALVNLALLYLVNTWPGWDAVPFLTDETTEVLTWVNASLVAGAVANGVYVVHDARWLRAFGDAFVAGIAIAAIVRLWQVFPFDFGGGYDWAPTLVRILLVLGIVGSAIGIGTNLLSLVTDRGSRS